MVRVDFLSLKGKIHTMMIMKTALLWTALMTAPLGRALAATAPNDVGVDEHLGATVPLDTRFNDEDGRPVALGELIDKPVILTLNFFRCSGICTPLLNGLVDGLNELKLEAGKDYQVITVSFDPNDDPMMAQMKRRNYLAQLRRPFPAQAWRFLTGHDPAIHRLTEAVGFKFKPAGTQFVHPGVIVILSPTGRVTRYMYGIAFPPLDLQMALTEATRGQARPSVIKALQFCYDYDPAGRTFIFRLNRLVGAGMLVLVLGLVAFLSLRPRKSP